MLVLTRKNNESVVIGGSVGFERQVKVTVIEIRGRQVRLGFEAESDISIQRSEVWARIRTEQEPIGLPS